MPCWRQQSLLEAPVETVWRLISDPSRYPEWAGEMVEVTGVPDEVERGSTFKLRDRTPLGPRMTTTFKVEEMDDLHEIKLRCQASGYYSRWLLTEARGSTFAEVEMGVDRTGLPALSSRALSLAVTKGYLRRQVETVVDGVQRVLRTSPQ